MSTQFIGARFTLDGAFHITSIGGHFKGYVGDDRSLFLAIIPLSAPTALPTMADLAAPLFATTFVAPYNDVGPYPYQVPDTLISTSLDLAPGSYGLVVGSGLFGATGTGWMPVSGPTQSLPWYFMRNAYLGDDFRDVAEQPVRFLVNGDAQPVSEPPVAALVLLALGGVLAAYGRRTIK